MEKRFFSHPKSLFELVIAGFSLVAVPLIVALISGAFYVDRLSEQSHEAVYRAVQATQKSRVLLEQVTTMERSIRQYFVLKDELLLKSYLNRHQTYQTAAGELEALLLDDTLRERLSVLNGHESDLFARLNGQGGDPKSIEQDFIALTEMAQSILKDSNSLIDSEVEVLGFHDRTRTPVRLEIGGGAAGAAEGSDR